MGNQVGNIQTTDSSRSSLFKVSAAAALIEGILLLIGVLGLMTALLQPGNTTGLLPALQNNWLIVIFKLHAGFGGIQIGFLHVLDFLDIAILALAGIMYFGLYAVIWRTSRIWSIVASIQPFLGIVLFIVTKSAGRSAVMGAALVISLVMLRSRIFNKATAYWESWQAFCYWSVTSAQACLLGDSRYSLWHCIHSLNYVVLSDCPKAYSAGTISKRMG